MKSRSILIIALLIFLTTGLKSQVISTFTPRYQVTQKGGIVFLSNVGTTCFVADTNALPPNTGISNNNTPSQYVDHDNDPTTFSSTSDSLNLAPCSEISFVGLYWGGNATSSTIGWNSKDTIKIKANNGSYIQIKADSLITNTIGFTTYHCFKDVTNIVKAAGLNARWTVANVVGQTAQNNKFAGWNMIVVYKNDLQNMRQLTVFNGLAVVNTATVDIPVSGFLTPPTGPVTFEMGLYCYDGDRSTNGDALSFNGAGTFVSVNDAINPANNAFNSTVGRNGVLTSFRRPNYNNNYSIDADIFIPNNTAKNFIGNSATSCTLRQTTSGDVYLTQAVSFAIDVYSPDVRAAVSVQDINGGTVQPGDTLEYTVTGKNIGSDPSINTFITDSIEQNADYIPGTIVITAGPNLGAKTDGLSDDQAEYLSASRTVRVRIGTGANGTTGGQVNDSPFGIDSTTFKFRVKVSSDCYKLACDNIINNSALITGTGITSGITYTNASNPGIFDAFGCPIPGATTTPINSSSCIAPPDTSISVCNIPAVPTFASIYTRPGYVFYNSGGTVVTSPSTAGNYYAVYTAYAGCTDTVNIVVSFVCNPPVANGDNGSTLTEDGANGTINVLTNDTDPQGNPSTPTNGAGQFTVDLNTTSGGVQTTNTTPQGVWTYNSTTGEVTFDPANDFNGTATLIYQLCDPSSLCDTAVISFIVTPVNDPPVANDDNGSALTEDGPNGTVNVLTNDTDIDGNPTAPVNGVGQFTVDLDPGTAGIQTTFTDAQGVWTLNTATGVVTFDPANNYNGTAVIPYTLCDPSGACDNANIIFVVTPVNDPPVANDDNGGTLAEDGANGTVNIIANDTDLEGNPTAPVNGVGQFTVDLDPGTAGIQTTFTEAQGVWTLNTATGVVTFDPANNYNGTAVIPYTLCDPSGACDNANITFVVTPVNDAPIANGDNGSTNEDTPITLPNILANDVDVDNTLSPTNIDLDPLTPGIQSTESTPEGNWSVNTATGQVTFTPATNFNGTATNIYEICDGGSPNLCDTAVITINVTPINDAPVANADNGSTIQNTPVTLPNILSNDVDVDNTLSPTNIDLDPLTPGIQSAESTPEGTWSVNTTTGEVTFTPDVSFSGTATNIYEICDGGTPNLCDTAVISIVVSPGTPPVALGDNGPTLTEDGANGTINILTNDTDANGNPSAPTNGVGQFTVDLNTTTGGVQTTNTTPQGVWTYNATTGEVTFDPANDFNGTATLIYELCDPTSLCDTAVITFEVNAINDAPVANDDNATTNEDTPTTINVLTNDSDTDNPLQVPTVITNPTNGTVTVNADSTITYTPNANFNGADTFTYSICDGGTPNLCDTATVIITINAINDAPIANDDTNTTSEDTPVSGTVATNDTDVDGPSITITEVTPPSNGTIVLNTDGTYTYTPNTNFNGADTITYSYCDGGTPDLCDTAILVITINAINDAPVANDDAATTDEDTPTTIAVLTNDSDVDNPLQPPVIVSNPGNGTVTVNADSTITYTPDLNFNGSDTFTYVICDGGTPNLCDTATVIITVNAINDAPVATDNTNTTDEETAVSGNVYSDQTSDSDVDGPGINITQVSGPSNGIITLNTDGSYTYTPNTGFNGADTITYSYCDGGTPDLCDTAILVITVNAINDAPVANDDAATTDEDTPVSGTVVANDSDVDGPSINITEVSGPSNGSIVLNTDGTYTYTPSLNFNGNDTIIYSYCDGGIPNLCDTAILVITVNPVNDAPIISQPPVVTDEDTPVNFCPTLSDVDAGDVLTLSNCGGPSNGTAVISANCVTYTPNPNYNGPDTICLIVCDNGTPVLCDTTLVPINVLSIDDAPIAENDINSTLINTPVTGDVSTNDYDLDGDPLVYNTTPLTAPQNGTVVLNANGTYTYTPNNGFVEVDEFQYIVCAIDPNCDTAWVYIDVTTVTSDNEAPVANNDVAQTFTNIPVSGNVLNNDYDVDGTTIIINTTPVTNPTNGTVVLNADGSYTYTPDTDFVGTDEFTYSICDADGLCDTATVFIDVLEDPNGSLNDAPFAQDDAYVTPVNVSVSGDVSLNDVDPNGDPLTYGTSPVTTPVNGTVVINADGAFTYTPNPSYIGPDQFTYSVCDNNGACDTATVYITVLPSQPVAVLDLNSTTPNTPVSGNVLTNDEDSNGLPLTVNTTAVSGPSNGTLVLNADGTYTYTPNNGFVGTDTFYYEVCNGFYCVTVPVIITVTSGNPLGNDAPIANDDQSTTLENVPVSGQVLNNDLDPDGDVLTTTQLVNPTNGTVVFNSNGTYTYTPNNGFVGNDEFTYSACDPSGLCDTATVYITVLSDGNGPANDAPFVQDDSYVTNEDTPISGNVSLNDSDPNGDVLVYNTTPLSGPAHGTVVLNADGTFTYTPTLNYNGPDQFIYVACDNNGACDTATVYILVLPVNDAPVANDDVNTTPEETPVSGTVATNDTDIDGVSVNITLVNGPSNGTIVLNADGTYTYAPNSGFNGNDTITYSYCDGGVPELCDTAILVITVTPINDPPVAVDDFVSTPEDVAVVINVLSNDTDPENNIVPIPTIISGPSNGTAVVNNDGTITYTPDENFNGFDTLAYVICDSGTPVYCDTAIVVIDVTPVADTPVLTPAPVITPEDVTVTACFPFVTDNNLDSVSAQITCGPDNGTIDTIYVENGTVCIVYTPNLNYNGPDEVCITLCDLSNGLCLTETIQIEVTPEVDPCYWLKGISPNGDAQNDAFYVNCNEDYPNSTMQVFNRWGDQVWDSEGHYVNNFEGKNGRGEILPDGTYYYIYEYKDGSGRKHAGFVQITR